MEDGENLPLDADLFIDRYKDRISTGLQNNINSKLNSLFPLMVILTDSTLCSDNRLVFRSDLTMVIPNMLCSKEETMDCRMAFDRLSLSDVESHTPAAAPVPAKCASVMTSPRFPCNFWISL